MAKRRFRLGLWSRLGIVVTAFWMVGATLYWAGDGFRGNPSPAWIALRSCEQRNALQPTLPRENCDAEYERVSRQDRSGALSIKALRKEHAKHVDVRNRVCHAHCAGRFKSDPDWIVFAPVKDVRGEPGQMLVEAIHLDQMRAAAAFAKHASKNLNRIIDAALARRE